MPYGRSRLTASAQLGDPFLGGLVRGIGRAAGGFLRGGPLGALGALLPRPGGPPTQIQARRLPPGPLPFLQQAPLPASVFPRPRPPTGMPRPTRMPGDAPRRRRMNPLNVKALRRSTRRLAGFQREAKKVEKQLRKIAPQRRSSRRDLGPGHRHIR